MRRGSAPVLVAAVPALNEEAYIGPCLQALAGQVGAKLDHIVVLANNCTDRTAAVARAVQLPPGITLHVVEEALAPPLATAGVARRRVMEIAASLAGDHGVLFTTDADGQVESDWLAATLQAMDAGADVVAGWVELDPVDWGRIPISLHEDDARETEYDGLCDEIHARLDPDPADPWPRHTQHSGASIAVTAEMYALCGGIPPIAAGEDRALIAALRRVDARVRHAPEVHVVVSGRTIGRATGGMADTILRRLEQPDQMLDDRLEPATDCARRAVCRGQARQAFLGKAGMIPPLARRLGLPPSRVVAALEQRFFGEAWTCLEGIAPSLRRRGVAVTDLASQVAIARAILLRLEGGEFGDMNEGAFAE